MSVECFIDTNVLVRYLTQDDPAQARRASAFIAKEVAAGDRCFIGSIVLRLSPGRPAEKCRDPVADVQVGPYLSGPPCSILKAVCLKSLKLLSILLSGT